MGLNFPNAPTVGQVFTAEGVSFVWSGAVWYVLDPFPWATDAEGVAGVAQSKLMTPASSKALLDTVSSGEDFIFGTPQNVLASRAANVNYQHTGSYPMMVAMTFIDRDNVADMELQVGPNNVNPLPIVLARARANRSSGNDTTIVGVVPPSWRYRLSTVARSPSPTQWWEWRP